MAPPTQNPENPTVTRPKDLVTFFYKGVEYDTTQYISKHPGGPEFLTNMHTEKRDITEYFKALHSIEAEKTLRSFPKLSEAKETPESLEYMKILKRVEHLYAPDYRMDAFLLSLVALLFLLGCFANNWFLGAVGFGLAQILGGWVSHSMDHSRHPVHRFLGKRFGALLGGFSEAWWSPKHNMHHMFTNSERYDDDIKHNYKVYLYPFLYLKWRFDSLVQAIKTKDYLEIALMAVNYMFALQQRVWVFLLGELVAGFYSAFVLIGNHEREHRFKGQINMDFIDHQIIACRNYREESFLMLLMMGGMQYQTEHHLFPQIPFYNLPQAAKIIKEELDIRSKKIIYGDVLGQ